MFLTGVFKVMARGDDLKALARLHCWLCMDSSISAHNTLMKTVECAYSCALMFGTQLCFSTEGELCRRAHTEDHVLHMLLPATPLSTFLLRIICICHSEQHLKP